MISFFRGSALNSVAAALAAAAGGGRPGLRCALTGPLTAALIGISGGNPRWFSSRADLAARWRQRGWAGLDGWLRLMSTTRRAFCVWPAPDAVGAERGLQPGDVRGSAEGGVDLHGPGERIPRLAAVVRAEA